MSVVSCQFLTAETYYNAVVTFYKDIFNMKFVYNFYILIIILEITWGVQSVADFTLKELNHISQELNPMECMRLIEAIYLAIPRESHNRISRETPVNMQILKQTCLDELKAWNNQFPDKAEIKARAVMILHLNALGRPDLANYVRKYRRILSKFADNVVRFFEDNNRIANHRAFKRDTNNKKLNHYLRTRKLARRSKRAKIVKRTNRIAELEGQLATPRKNDSEKRRRTLIASNSSLFVTIALIIVVTFISVMVLLIFQKLLMYSICFIKRSDSCPRNKTTHEKEMQCIGCLQDGENDSEIQLNCVRSQISEIDVEGGSCVRSISRESHRSICNKLVNTESIAPAEIPIGELELSEEEISDKDQNLSSCRCRPTEIKTCGSKAKRRKKSKRKCRAKSNEETKSTMDYLKAMQEKIMPKQKRKMQKDCIFDTKQFQDKIMRLLNQDCGVCQCCNCTPNRELIH